MSDKIIDKSSENISSDDLKKIKKLLQDNIKLTKEVKSMVKSVKSYLFWSRVWGIFKFLIIVVPIVLGLIYLPPLLEKGFNSFKGTLGIDKVQDVLNVVSGASEIPVDYQRYLK